MTINLFCEKDREIHENAVKITELFMVSLIPGYQAYLSFLITSSIVIR